MYYISAGQTSLLQAGRSVLTAPNHTANDMQLIPILKVFSNLDSVGPSASTGEYCICIVSDLLWLGLVWSCFVFCLLFLLFSVICAPVLTEGTDSVRKAREAFLISKGRTLLPHVLNIREELY